MSDCDPDACASLAWSLGLLEQKHADLIRELLELEQRLRPRASSGALREIIDKYDPEVVRSDDSKPNRTRPIPGNPYGAGIVDCTEASDE